MLNYALYSIKRRNAQRVCSAVRVTVRPGHPIAGTGNRDSTGTQPGLNAQLTRCVLVSELHRSTMRVVDGMHRLRAAKLRGQETIAVRYVDGDEASAFLVAVRANIAHGLSLIVTDHKAAAARIMDLYPHWSDRMIAKATALTKERANAQDHRRAERGGRGGFGPGTDSVKRQRQRQRQASASPRVDCPGLTGPDPARW